jgi:hypothetical protein
MKLFLMGSGLSGLGGAFFWGRDRYRMDKNIRDTAVYSVHGFMFYSSTWLATVPMNIYEQTR